MSDNMTNSSDAAPAGEIVFGDLAAYILDQMQAIVEQRADEVTITVRGVPEMGQEFTQREGGVEVRMVVTGIGADGKTVEAERATWQK